MQVTVNLASVKKALIEVGAVAALVVPEIESVPMPTAARPVVASVGGIVLAISHYFANLAAYNPPAAATDAAKASPAPEAQAVPSGPPAVA